MTLYGVSIALMGVLYLLFGQIYHWGFVIMVSLVFGGIALMIPLRKFVPKELSKLSNLLTKRAKELETQST